MAILWVAQKAARAKIDFLNDEEEIPSLWIIDESHAVSKRTIVSEPMRTPISYTSDTCQSPYGQRHERETMKEE